MIRTWLYLGDIVGPDGDTQRYKELNRARSEFFSSCTFGTNRSLLPTTAQAYPASTGIGADGRDLGLSCIALASRRRDLQVIPLENPRQTSAFDYAPDYSPQSPKFSRAMAVEVGTEAMILVSGTASITRSETRHAGDAAAQARQTLANIEALIAEPNLSRHGLPGFGAELHDLAVARVYIKRADDHAAVRAGLRSLPGPGARDVHARGRLPPSAPGGDRGHRLLAMGAWSMRSIAMQPTRLWLALAAVGLAGQAAVSSSQVPRSPSTSAGRSRSSPLRSRSRAGGPYSGC